MTKDFRTADTVEIFKRHLVLEMVSKSVRGQPSTGVEQFLCLPRPRIAKTHLPGRYNRRHLLKDKPKTIVLMRNPKDVLVSYYHLHRMCDIMGMFSGSWDDFFLLAKEQKLLYGDIFDWYVSWWRFRNEENVLVLKYEDMVRDLPTAVRTLDGFVSSSADEETIHRIVQRTSFGALKANPMTNMKNVGMFHQDVSPYFRKGITGDWKNYFTPQQNEFMEQMYKEKCLKVGMTFEYE